ncbi:MAG TPA: hypothetical protein VIG33_12415 [Pseudobdellovibrionaceae bacterium]|jgi:hypothetical protein
MRKIFSIILLTSTLSSATFASDLFAHQCAHKAVQAALAIAKINGVKGGLMLPSKVLKTKLLAASEDYLSVAMFYVGNKKGDASFSYKVEIGDASELGGSSCEVMAVFIPQP